MGGDGLIAAGTLVETGVELLRVGSSNSLALTIGLAMLDR